MKNSWYMTFLKREKGFVGKQFECKLKYYELNLKHLFRIPCIYTSLSDHLAAAPFTAHRYTRPWDAFRGETTFFCSFFFFIFHILRSPRLLLQPLACRTQWSIQNPDSERTEFCDPAESSKAVPHIHHQLRIVYVPRSHGTVIATIAAALRYYRCTRRPVLYIPPMPYRCIQTADARNEKRFGVNVMVAARPLLHRQKSNRDFVYNSLYELFFFYFALTLNRTIDKTECVLYTHIVIVISLYTAPGIRSRWLLID